MTDGILTQSVKGAGCKFPTEELMCAHNFNFALRFPQNAAFLAQDFVFLEENFHNAKFFIDEGWGGLPRATTPPMCSISSAAISGD